MISIVLSAILATAGGAVAAYPEESQPGREHAMGTIARQYQEQAKAIVSAVMEGNDAYRKMEELCDGIGHRLSGSKRLERAVDWAADAMRRDGADRVAKEPVMVPHWERGRESLTMLEPQHYELAMIGLGMSVGTPPDGITAEVVTVADKEALDNIGDKAEGRIVLFNYKMSPYDEEGGAGYGDVVRFRYNGAKWAAEKGAVAALVRSVTAGSLRSPHTGGMSYGDAERKIPAAAVSIEDAEMIARLNARGIYPKVRLVMGAKNHGEALSHNVIGELRGREKPDEYVVIGGHLDSWDAGHGAHDDGAGCVMAMEVINVLRKLDMIPRRTIRVVLWTNEENGLAGGKAYAKDHADEMDRHVAAIESDSGAFSPRGYSLECADDQREAVAVEQIADIVSAITGIDNLTVSAGGSGADISPMRDAGVVLMGHRVDGSIYFDYHHSHADTLDKVDPVDLSRNVAVMAVVAYVIADMPERLGKHND